MSMENCVLLSHVCWLVIKEEFGQDFITNKLLKVNCCVPSEGIEMD